MPFSLNPAANGHRCSTGFETQLLAKIVIPGVGKSKSENMQIGTKHLKKNGLPEDYVGRPESILGFDSREIGIRMR
jgi:hypothetical protein